MHRSMVLLLTAVLEYGFERFLHLILDPIAAIGSILALIVDAYKQINDRYDITRFHIPAALIDDVTVSYKLGRRSLSASVWHRTSVF